ncbi:hypothetical protein RSAG8_13772, partial [Rhizoctonia solani AG-8 WAC10335]
MLVILHDQLDLNCAMDAAIFAAALFAFWCQCRLGELLGSTKRRHDPRRYPSRASINTSTSPNGSHIIQLPRTKCSQSRGETIIITKQSSPLDPTTALNHLTTLLPNIPDSEHLFAYSTPTSKDIICLTKEVFLKRVNEIWAKNGLNRHTGHSFRIGGTTALLKAGVPPDVVRSMG